MLSLPFALPMILPIGVLSKKLIGQQSIRRSILLSSVWLHIFISSTSMCYLLCNTRPALRHMNSVLIARNMLSNTKIPVKPTMKDNSMHTYLLFLLSEVTTYSQHVLSISRAELKNLIGNQSLRKLSSHHD